MRITEIRPAADVEALLAGIRDGSSFGSPERETWRHRLRDGTIIDVEISAGRIVFEGRAAALVVSRDVTERRRMEERLAEAEKMEAIGRLAGGVAHDFNNLLTVISGYAAILRETRRRREPLDEIEHAAEQAGALTRQLLAFSRRQVLQPALRRRQRDRRRDGADARAHHRRRRARQGPARGRRRARRGRPRADRARRPQPRRQRARRDAARRAADDRDRGRRCSTRSYVATHGDVTPGPHVLLAISDTGTGMSEEVRRRLFEPFFTRARARPSSTRRQAERAQGAQEAQAQVRRDARGRGPRRGRRPGAREVLDPHRQASRP